MERQFEYRIKYQHAQDVMTNYHYYMCESAERALEYQMEMIEHHNWNVKLISLEKKCPYTNKWENMSEVLTASNGL